MVTITINHTFKPGGVPNLGSGAFHYFYPHFPPPPWRAFFRRVSFPLKSDSDRSLLLLGCRMAIPVGKLVDFFYFPCR